MRLCTISLEMADWPDAGALWGYVRHWCVHLHNTNGLRETDCCPVAMSRYLTGFTAAFYPFDWLAPTDVA